MSVQAVRGVALATTYTHRATFPALHGVRKLTIIVTGGDALLQLATDPSGALPPEGLDEIRLPAGYNAKAWPSPIYGFRLRGATAGVGVDVEVAG